VANAEDFRKGSFEFATGTGVDERIERAVAVSQPETAAEKQLRHTRRTQSINWKYDEKRKPA